MSSSSEGCSRAPVRAADLTFVDVLGQPLLRAARRGPGRPVLRPCPGAAQAPIIRSRWTRRPASRHLVGEAPWTRSDDRGQGGAKDDGQHGAMDDEPQPQRSL